VDLGLDVEIVAPRWRVPGEISFDDIHNYFSLPPSIRVRHIGPRLSEARAPTRLLRASLALPALLAGRCADATLHHHKDPLGAMVARRWPGIHVLELVSPPRRRDMPALSVVHGLVAITPGLAETVITTEPTLSGRVIGLRGGFDPSLAPWRRVGRVDARHQYNLPRDARVVAYSGKVTSNSSELPMILEACSGLGVIALVAGGTRQAQTWLTSICPPDVDLRCVGFMPPSELARFYAAADVLASYYPSDYPTLPWIDPGKIYPYLASGRPVVAADHSCLHDLLVGGINAELARPDAPQVLRESIRLVLENPDYAHALAENGARTASENTIGQRAGRILRFAEELRTHAETVADEVSPGLETRHR
jgi:hypothetical protein